MRLFTPTAVVRVLLAATLSACNGAAHSGIESRGGVGQDVASGPPALRLSPYFDGAAWGYRDVSGSVVVAPRFQAAGEFASARALVLLDDTYLYIDAAGTVVGDLPARDPAATALPLPTDSCASLEAYIAELGTRGDVYSLTANPTAGERSLELSVRALEFGALQVTEHGYEGTSQVLVLPRADLHQARAVLWRILAHHLHEDVTAKQVFEADVVTFELPAADLAGEFYGIRLRRSGGVAIHHTTWVS